MGVYVSIALALSTICVYIECVKTKDPADRRFSGNMSVTTMMKGRSSALVLVLLYLTYCQHAPQHKSLPYYRCHLSD
jgi:hypothetical protein